MGVWLCLRMMCACMLMPCCMQAMSVGQLLFCPCCNQTCALSVLGLVQGAPEGQAMNQRRASRTASGGQREGGEEDDERRVKRWVISL